MKKNELIRVWNDVVGIRDLAVAILISLIGTMTGFFLAPNHHSTMQLLFGLIGAIVAFLFNSFFIKPKRTVRNQRT